jgi:pimeloyl-ACP methyl ester carboxylesterase
MYSSRTTILLVHGAWWGAWIWHKLIPRLEEAGHQVLAPDLPGVGLDRTPHREATFASSVDRILDLIDHAKEPVILVGHGCGGVIISQVAEERPENIHHLAYLTALVPRNGEAALDAYKAFDQGHPLLPSVERDDVSVRLPFDIVCPLWFHDCSPTDMLLAERLLRPQALLPMQTPVALSQRFEMVPRTYLTCAYDRVLPPSLQAQISHIAACQHAISLPSGHMPSLAIPAHLAAQLDRVAQQALTPS